MLASLALLCCASTSAGDTVLVGSKNFTESHLLGEIMSLMIEAHTDLEVEHRAGLGGTLVCFNALRSGELDVYADYTGTAWAIVLKEPGKTADPLRAFVRVQTRFRELYGIEWLSPFGFNNTYAIAMAPERAAELGVRTISELVPHAGELRSGFSIEFLEREDGYLGLRSFYGLDLGQPRGMEHALAYAAIAGGEIDLIDAYSTDGKLLRYELTILEDDRGFFPPYHGAPLVRGALLEQHPEVGTALERLAFRISDEEMIRLNYAVEEGGEEFREVAVEFLRSKGLLDASFETEGEAGAPRKGGFLPYFAGRWRETLRLGWEHVQLTLIAVLLAALVAIPAGIAITRSELAQRLSLGAAGALQTVPSLALLAFMIAVPGLGLSARSAIVALFLYALLPILRNTFTGIREVDPELVDAARGMGLTPLQILLRVQLPLATRTIMAGIRTATVISIGVATLAAFIGAGGLGEPIITGLYLNDSSLILAGALPAALLALAADHGLGRLERILTPHGLRDQKE